MGSIADDIVLHDLKMLVELIWKVTFNFLFISCCGLFIYYFFLFCLTGLSLGNLSRKTIMRSGRLQLYRWAAILLKNDADFATCISGTEPGFWFKCSVSGVVYMNKTT